MLKKSLFTSLLNICKDNSVEKRVYIKWESVIDHISDHNIYIFSTGWYSVSSLSLLGWIHEVWEIEPPSMVGEGVFFWAFKKPIKIVCESDTWGEVYVLSEKTIGRISKENDKFHEILMRACLAVTNERINEANTERTIAYTLVDALEITHLVRSQHSSRHSKILFLSLMSSGSNDTRYSLIFIRFVFRNHTVILP